jgi:hypothetical protein
MKDQIRNFVIGTGLAALLWAPLLKAQESVEVAKVPFDFHVNNLTLPAGKYTVMTTSDHVTIQLRNDGTGKSILFMPPGRTIGNLDPRLLFHCYGDNCFLAEIWVPNGPAYTMRKGSLESEIERGGLSATVAYVSLQRGQ